MSLPPGTRIPPAEDDLDKGWMELYYQAAAQRDAFEQMWQTYIESRPVHDWWALVTTGTAGLALGLLTGACLAALAWAHMGG